MSKNPPLSLLAVLVVSLGTLSASNVDLPALLKPNDVIWDAPGNSSADSMPIGNGDIGLNVWTEPNGDVVFYIGKTDAWTENPKGTVGLAKIGKVRISTTPALFSGTNHFEQALHLYDGEMLIKGDNGELHLWVDANAPVVHVSVRSKVESELKVSLDPYRLPQPVNPGATNPGDIFRSPGMDELKPDYHAEGLKDRLAWCHFNGTTNGLGKPTTPEVVNWGFGALIQGTGMTASGTGTLTSPLPWPRARRRVTRNGLSRFCRFPVRPFQPLMKSSFRPIATGGMPSGIEAIFLLMARPKRRKSLKGMDCSASRPPVPEGVPIRSNSTAPSS
ncbi:MAG: DUF5703 domain-containing protein [bacterium]